MGLFNWLSWQLERRVMMKEMDRLRDESAESKEQLLFAKRDIAELRSDLGEVEQLLHEAQVGAKLTAEEQDNLKTQLELHKSAAAYWESVAKNQQKRIAEFRSKAQQENQNNGPF